MKNNFYFFRTMRMRQDLDEIHKKVVSVEELAIRALRVIRQCLLDLKEHSLHHDFETKAEEMFFFKVIKPDLSSCRIYYMELFNWWKDRPKETSGAMQKAYWEDKIKMIDGYFETHRQFSKNRESELMRFCEDMADPENRSMFYHRDIPGDRSSSNSFGELRFSNSDDEIAATLMAYGRLSHFCLRQIEILSSVTDNLRGSETVNAGSIGGIEKE